MSEDRIWKLLEKIDEKIDDICGRLLKVEINQKNHYKEIELKRASKDKKFILIIAGMGIIFTVIQFIQAQGLK